jgi:hypothetical protein
MTIRIVGVSSPLAISSPRNIVRVVQQTGQVIRVTSGGRGVIRLTSSGSPGRDGKSAYDLAAENGYSGTPQEWLSEFGGLPTWGGIGGDISDQTDLVSALATKAPSASPVFTGTATANAVTVHNGNIGPFGNAQLHVKSDTSSAVVLIDGAAGVSQLRLYRSGVHDATITAGSGSINNLRLSVAGTDILCLRNGNAGVGTTNPTQKLQVEGNILANGTVTGTNLSGTNTGDQTTITGNAGTATALQTARAISITGGITAAGINFNGTANVALSANVNAGHITLARMASVATGTVFYRKTAATGAPEVQTLATLKTDLGLTGTNSGDETAATILNKLLTVDGASSGLDADTLDGVHASAFAVSGHSHDISSVTGLQALLDGKQPAGDYATLTAGKIPTSQLPGLALTEVNTVASQAAMLALTAQSGDVAIRSDLKKTFAHNGGTTGTVADWSELLTPTDAVTSVNGLTGVVTLTKANVGLSNVDNTSDAAKPVSTAVQTALNLKADVSHNHDTAYQPLDSQLTDFAGLTYTGNGSKILQVNSAATGLEWVTPADDATWGAISGTLADQTDLQAALNAKAGLATVTSGAAGLAPASGGGAANFLRADGTWAAPAGVAATVADIRAETGTGFVTPALQRDAAALVTLTDASTVAVNWTAFRNSEVTLTANRTIGTPTNGIVGTRRTLLLKGNSSTARTATFASGWKGTLPALTKISSTAWYLIEAICLASDHFAVLSSAKVNGVAYPQATLTAVSMFGGAFIGYIRSGSTIDTEIGGSGGTLSGTLVTGATTDAIVVNSGEGESFVMLAGDHAAALAEASSLVVNGTSFAITSIEVNGSGPFTTDITISGLTLPVGTHTVQLA